MKKENIEFRALVFVFISLGLCSFLLSHKSDRYTEGFVDGFSQALYTIEALDSLPIETKEELMAKLRRQLQ